MTLGPPSVIGMTNRAAPAPIAPGNRLGFPVPGTGYVVTLVNSSRPGADVWKVVTTVGNGFQVDAYTATFDDEAVARAEARRLCRELHAATHDGGPRPATLDEARNARQAAAQARTAADVKLTPAAKGTQTHVSKPGAELLGRMVAAGGSIRRSKDATLPQLTALARRGFVELDGQAYRPTGATILRAGRIAHEGATGADQLTYALSA